jgi:mannose-6-phosphate isomerase
MGGTPVQISPRFVERVWGSTDLSPWFGKVEAKTGEVWFDAGPILIKFLFTSEPLSVQVHPDDRYALRNENASGKTEMWYILRGDARLA